MRKYRIKREVYINDSSRYYVQVRILIIFWRTIYPGFDTYEDAKQYIKSAKDMEVKNTQFFVD